MQRSISAAASGVAPSKRKSLSANVDAGAAAMGLKPDLPDDVMRVDAMLLEKVRVQLVVDLLRKLRLELLSLFRLAFLRQLLDQLVLGDLHDVLLSHAPSGTGRESTAVAGRSLN